MISIPFEEQCDEFLLADMTVPVFIDLVEYLFDLVIGLVGPI